MRSWLLALGFLAVLSHCSGDETKRAVAEAGAGGESGGEGPAPQAGGSRADAGAAGEIAIEGGAGGQAPSPVLAGQGGAEVLQGGASGAATEAQGGACGVAPNPGGCCDPSDPPCDESWPSVCYNDWNVTHRCCDSTEGVRRSCRYDGDFYTYDDQVCLNECTGKSFGTTSCAGCLMGEMPLCVTSACSFDISACEDPVAGYVLDCSAGTSVVCTCDPDL